MVVIFCRGEHAQRRLTPFPFVCVVIPSDIIEPMRRQARSFLMKDNDETEGCTNVIQAWFPPFPTVGGVILYSFSGDEPRGRLSQAKPGSGARGRIVFIVVSHKGGSEEQKELMTKGPCRRGKPYPRFNLPSFFGDYISLGMCVLPHTSPLWIH